MPAAPAQPASEAIPEGVKGWSWGAFLLNWIWAIGNRTWIGLLALIPYIGFIFAIWLGIKGREMAWKNGKWESLEHFNRVQKSWSRWAVGLTFGVMLLGIVAAVAIPAYQNYRNRAEEQKLSDEISAAMSAPVNTPSQEVAPALPTASGSFDINSDNLPATLNTIVGQLAQTQLANGQSAVTLNGTPLFNGDDAAWQKPVRLFQHSDSKQFVLMTSSGGRGNSCEALFFFLVVQASGVTATPEFGTCAPQGSFAQDGGKITITMPKMGGNTVVVFDGTDVTEDGQPVVLAPDNDPSK
ncbi:MULTISPECIES: hypothetical protein [unclassified Duganella]|uniref:hypothetical protein n=1 Tax=unclassified Duganella TaxID=2636909 RepID=UPI001E4EB724|nr:MULTISPECIES: hypothetical protein [unclassified Duganella]